MFCEAAEWVWLKEENEFSSIFFLCVLFSLLCSSLCHWMCQNFRRVAFFLCFRSEILRLASLNGIGTGGRRQRKKCFYGIFVCRLWSELRERVWMIFWTFCWPCQLFNYLRISEIIENSLTYFPAAARFCFFLSCSSLHMHSKECDMNPRNDFYGRVESRLESDDESNRSIGNGEYTYEHYTHHKLLSPRTQHEWDSDTFLHHPTDDTSSSRLNHHNFPTKHSRWWCEEEEENQRYSNLSIYTTFTQNEKDQN